MNMPRITARQEQMQALGRAGGLRLLFIGNSATYVHDLPKTLSCLAAECGYHIEVKSIVKGGYELAQHADIYTERGRMAYDAIAEGYDAVFLQDNGNCVTTEEKSIASRNACAALYRAITAAGSNAYIYVRPPYEYEHAGRTPLAQCVAFDALFGEIAAELGVLNAYVNRAFAYAMTRLDYDLWGPDHAHISEHGAYLAVCVFFATLFGCSATALGANGLPQKDVRALQQVADLIAIDGVIPWTAEKKELKYDTEG